MRFRAFMAALMDDGKTLLLASFKIVHACDVPSEAFRIILIGEH